MKIENRQFVEIIGVITVIASIIFVGMQLLMDRRVALADQYFNRAESRMATLRTQLESDAHLSREVTLWENGQRPTWWNDDLEQLSKSGGLSGSETPVYLLNVQLVLLSYDNIYYQYNNELIEYNFWLEFEKSLKTILSDPNLRTIYTNMGVLLPIQKLMSDIIDEIDNE